jgi:hypothetical protein
LIEVLRFLYAKKLRKKRGRVLETLVLDLRFERASGVEVLRGFDVLGSARILGDGARGLKMDITITRDRLFYETGACRSNPFLRLLFLLIVLALVRRRGVLPGSARREFLYQLSIVRGIQDLDVHLRIQLPQ